MEDEQSFSYKDALRRLIAEIAVGDYRDPLHQRLTFNTAYIEGAALLQLNDTLDSGTPLAGGD